MSEDVNPEVSNEVAEDVQPESVAEETNEVSQAPSEPQSFKVKVNGEEHDVSVDDLIKGYQTGRGAHSKFQEAAKLKSEMDQILANFTKDPVEGLREFGIDAKEFAYSLISDQIEKESMSEEEVAQSELQKKYEQSQAELEQMKRDQESEQLNFLTEKYVQDYEKQIQDILTNSDLPKNAETVKRVANYMYESLESGYDLAPEHIVDLVKEDYNNAISSLLGDSSPEALIQFLGEDKISQIRKHDLSKLKSPEPSFKREEPKNKSKSKEKQSISDFMSELEDQYK